VDRHARLTHPSDKIRAERVAVVSALGLAGLKLATGLLTNSLGLISSAADSLLDVLISSLNLVSVRLADAPADAGHPYGHGKAENLAGLAQGLVFGGLGAWLCVEAARRITRGVRPEHAEWAIAVMLVSVVASWLISRHLRAVARRTDSAALEADSLHYASDVWTNAGVLVGLLLWQLTGSVVWDGLIGAGVGVLILRVAGQIVSRSVGDLMDAALPEAEQAEIAGLIRRHRYVVSSHDLRTRRAGSQRQIDFTIVACRDLPLGETHDLVDHVEKEIAAAIPGAHVVVHAEPCRPDCRETRRCVRDTGWSDLSAHEPR
jgi:ferrous-iron efflux pump FieF